MSGEKVKHDLQGCVNCRRLVRGANGRCPYCGEKLISPHGLHGRIKNCAEKMAAIPYIATWSIIIFCAFMFIIQLAIHFSLEEENADFFSLFGLTGINGLSGELLGSNITGDSIYDTGVWRLVTACFLHWGLIHIFFNMYALHSLGMLAEELWGRRRFLCAFLFTGIIGNISSLVYHVEIAQKEINGAGASGALCGILGMLIGYLYKNKSHASAHLRLQLQKWAILIIFFGVLVGADNAAHIGGLVSGLALGWFVSPKNFGRHERAWNVGTLISMAIITISFCFAAYNGITGYSAAKKQYQIYIKHKKLYDKIKQNLNSGQNQTGELFPGFDSGNNP